MVNPITLCDSIYVLSLTVSPSYNQYETQGICQSDLPYQWRDTLFLEGTETGDYVFHDTTAFGCDSIVTLHLMVSEIAFGDTLATACDSFVWRGVTYFETPIENPTDTLYGGSTSGCDSVTVLQLTILHSVSTVDTVTICEGELPYSYYDTLFEVGTLSGDYVFHNTAACGCDSVTTLHLQVNLNVHTTQVPFIICESMLPAVWHVPGASHPIPAGTTGDTIIVDTFHLAANGCDSIVTRRLIIGPSTDTTIVDTVVQNQLPYTLNGKQYNATGIYHDTTMNIAGCDSIITLDLTVFFNVATTLDSTICSNLLPFSWNGVSFTGADTQSVVLTASSGADSTVEMRLHVMEIPDVTISGPSVLCPEDSATLTAVTTTAIAYLWSTGDTTSSITVYAAGSYTVTVSNEYGCTQTTSLELSGTFVGNPIESFHSSGLCAGNDYLFGWASATNPSTNVTSVAIEGPWVTAVGDTAFLFGLAAAFSRFFFFRSITVWVSMCSSYSRLTHSIQKVACISPVMMLAMLSISSANRTRWRASLCSRPVRSAIFSASAIASANPSPWLSIRMASDWISSPCRAFSFSRSCSETWRSRRRTFMSQEMLAWMEISRLIMV